MLNCLEIGPFDCPVLRGSKVKYFDVLDQEGLKKRSVDCNRPFPPDNVPAANSIATSDEQVASKTIVSPFDAGTFTLIVISLGVYALDKPKFI